MVKVNSKDTRGDTISILNKPLKTSENQRFSGVFRGYLKWEWRRSCVCIANFEQHISHLVLVFLLLAWNMKLPAWIYMSFKQRYEGKHYDHYWDEYSSVRLRYQTCLLFPFITHYSVKYHCTLFNLYWNFHFAFVAKYE